MNVLLIQTEMKITQVVFVYGHFNFTVITQVVRYIQVANRSVKRSLDSDSKIYMLLLNLSLVVALLSVTCHA